MTDYRNAADLLSEALRAVAAEDAAAGASPSVEAALVTELRTLAARRRRRTRLAVSSLAAAAALLVAVAIQMRRSTATPNQSSRREVTTAYMPLAYSSVPMTDGHVVRMSVPRASLVSFGLVPGDAIETSASGMVLADVIVGDDGLARAVRFVRPVKRPESQR